MRNRFLLCAALIGLACPAFAQMDNNFSAGGAVKIGTSTTTCDATVEGAIRYNSTGPCMEFCDGSAWSSLCGGGGGSAVFTFTDQAGVATGTIIYSDIVVVTGLSGSETVSVSGDGTPQIRIASGSWVTSGTITDAQQLQVRLTSSGTGDTQYCADVTIGTETDTWCVTTASQLVLYRLATSVQGNFPAAEGGGRIGADTVCSNDQPAALSCGQVRAFITFSATDEIRDMPTNYGIPTGVPVYWWNPTTFTSNIRLGANWADIQDGSIENHIEIGGLCDDTGTPYECRFWLGQDNTHAAASKCVSWTSAASGDAGVATYRDDSWLESGINPGCNAVRHVLCLCVQ